MPISKSKLRHIKSLQTKKFRKIHSEFIVEGEKSLFELLNSGRNVKDLYLTPKFIEKNITLLERGSYYDITEKELSMCSSFVSNDAGIAVVEQFDDNEHHLLKDQLYFMLDKVRDPGNLGTIIRVADWYGVDTIVCSLDCADFYNPKVIRATMGSFLRVNVQYQDLEKCIHQHKLPVYGAFMKGKSIHELTTFSGGFLLMGNESNGISTELEKEVDQQISIPGQGATESLNVAIATSILCDNLMRLKTL